MEHKIEIKQKKWLTHNVMQFTLEKPKGFTYSAGQAVEVTLDDPEFKDKWAPFTFTSLNKYAHLEFTIKAYPKHEGITLALSKLEKGDHLVISDPWDSFKNKGPGVFIAGGTGVTPFIALLRQMEADGKVDGSKLLFSNKNEADIFLDEEFKRILGDNFIKVLTQEKKEPYFYGRIDKAFLKNVVNDFDQPFYLCGPENFADEIKGYLKELGAGDDLVNISL
ncbi:FAD-binding oxidoreductase [uncultured Draconibacterium sp.]|uniref:FAD-binding oxidoreductase n=1 Tax=uncultured Draconibacterium sp. TaxID=1573823 RepID=UPI0029C746D5|nr:FAD-binding oxidoreductase [uncultured Draconibacterium sp.]